MTENKNGGIKITKELVFVIVCLAVFVFAVYKTIFSTRIYRPVNIPSVFETNNPEGSQPTVPVFPTKSPEEIKIISEIETKRVDVNAKSIEPKTITVKLHDQVQFFNNVEKGKTITVIGEGWGGPLPIRFEENLTQPFNEAGTFTYKIPELNLTGEVVVK